MMMTDAPANANSLMMPRLITDRGPVAPIAPPDVIAEVVASAETTEEPPAFEALRALTWHPPLIAPQLAALPIHPPTEEYPMTEQAEGLVDALRQHAAHHEEESRRITSQIANLEVQAQHHATEAKRWAAALAVAIGEPPIDATPEPAVADLPPLNPPKRTAKRKAGRRKPGRDYAAERARAKSTAAKGTAAPKDKAPAASNGNGALTVTQMIMSTIAERKRPQSLDDLLEAISAHRSTTRGSVSVAIGTLVRAGQLLRAPDRSGYVGTPDMRSQLMNR